MDRFKTGDVARMDENGNIYLINRVKELIQNESSKTENIN